GKNRSDQYIRRSGTCACGDCELFSNSCGAIYAPYKEANGLRRLDEMDWTLGYERQTKIGTMGGGLLVQTMSDATGKANPFISGGSGYILTEFFLTYALPQFKDLKLYAGADVIRSDQYYKLTYSHEFPINDSMSVSVNTGPGYMVTQNLQGVRDVPTTVQLNVKGFNVGFNAVYRPKLEFFDTDTATTRAVWLDGGSTKADGLVADPSKYQAGVVSDAINGAITQAVRTRSGNTNYNYVPRQKLPHWLYFVNLGYTSTF
ncbi:MAG TPA: hypothetical protein PKC35_06475, partial [Leptospiraceae bacterium]|nr:hypothetical protein [Leptospiraceae bacterium]